MHLRIKGKTSKKFEKEISKAVEFFWNKLEIKEPIEQIKLCVRIENFKKKEDSYRGFCTIDNPLKYTIHINKNSIDKLKTLAHEMVHLKQYLHGELNHIDEDDLWMGELWLTTKEPSDAYYDSPWEIEAYGREYGLYQRWVNEHKKQGKKRGKSD